MKFSELLKPKVRVKKVSTVEPLRPSRPTMQECSTTVVIPAFERKEFINELKDKPIVVIDTNTTRNKTMFNAWITAVLTKNPHYKFIQCVKSSFSNNKPTFWFLNTNTKVTVILTKDEIHKLTEHKQRYNALTDAELKELYPEDFGK